MPLPPLQQRKLRDSHHQRWPKALSSMLLNDCPFLGEVFLKQFHSRSWGWFQLIQCGTYVGRYRNWLPRSSRRFCAEPLYIRKRAPTKKLAHGLSFSLPIAHSVDSFCQISVYRFCKKNSHKTLICCPFLSGNSETISFLYLGIRVT